MEGDDDRAAPEEQQRLERAMGQQMVHARRIHAEPAGHHHVPELADRGVGHYPLDVVLRDRDRRREDRRESACYRHHIHRGGREIVKGREPRHHEHARGDHRGRMDQGGDRRGAFHRVRQPDVKRKLGGFAHRPGKQQETDHGQHADLPMPPDIERQRRLRRRAGKDLLVLQRAEDRKDQHDAQAEPEVTDAIHHERLGRGVVRRLPVVPVPDQ